MPFAVFSLVKEKPGHDVDHEHVDDRRHRIDLPRRGRVGDDFAQIGCGSIASRALIRKRILVLNDAWNPGNVYAGLSPDRVDPRLDAGPLRRVAEDCRRDVPSSCDVSMICTVTRCVIGLAGSTIRTASPTLGQPTITVHANRIPRPRIEEISSRCSCSHSVPRWRGILRNRVTLTTAEFVAASISRTPELSHSPSVRFRRRM